MEEELDKLLNKVRDKDSLVRFVQSLRYDFSDNRQEWEIETIEDYLESMEAVLDATDVDYFEHEIPPSSWKVFALILVWASRYE
jgi:hypothetical protein